MRRLSFPLPSRSGGGGSTAAAKATAAVILVGAYSYHISYMTCVTTPGSILISIVLWSESDSENGLKDIPVVERP